MSETEIGEIESFAEEFADRLLKDYTQWLNTQTSRVARKEINDPVWGTIALTPVEVAIVDSPLVQRLRDIRQLGVVHWVYPGAVHTRFEHTLGVLFQTQSLIQAINRLREDGGAKPLIDRNFEQTLRIAALLHDIGHAVFSHVSEFALNEHPFIVAARNQFKDVHKGSLKHVSEIVAYQVVKSNAFAEFVEVLFSRFGGFVAFTEDRSANCQLFIKKVADTIVGNRISDEIPILHEIISGPFDADKLDYFIRDARNAGTPSVVDISRLIQKMTVREFSAAELPEDVARTVAAGPTTYSLFGVKWSGIPVLDELHLARVLLFSKVYKHGKVTAIEQMLALAIDCLIRVFGITGAMRVLYSTGDVQFLEISSEQACLAAGEEGKSLGADDQKWLQRFHQICSDLKHRRVHVKAFQAQRNYPDVDAEAAKDLELKMIEFIEDLDTFGGQREIKREVAELMAIVLEEADGQKVTADDLETRISISVSGPTPGGTQIGRAYVIPEAGRPLKFSNYTVNRTAWADGYMSDQPMAYFFTEAELADALFISLERVLRTKYDIRLPNSGMSASKRSSDRIDQTKQKLATSEFYRGVPHDTRATPPRLCRADIQPIIAKLETKFSIFEVPQAQSDASAPKSVDMSRIYDWLLQFEEDHRIECAIRCLQKLKFVRRADTIQAVKNFIGANPEFKGAPVIGFGDAKDSGAIQAYFVGDLAETYVSRVSSLRDEAELTPQPTHIIFVDDFIGSGGQSKDILAAGLGVDELRADLGEERGLFNVKEIELLKNAKIGFVFSAGWQAGKELLKDATQALGMNAEIHIDSLEDSIPFFSLQPDDALTQEQISDFYEFCETVGRNLILSGQDDPSTERAKEKADQRHSGYGNKGMLLATPSNTPTQSLTVLWASGQHNELDWLPLIPRRSKK